MLSAELGVREEDFMCRHSWCAEKEGQCMGDGGRQRGAREGLGFSF